jgi:hypothetical protein
VRQIQKDSEWSIFVKLQIILKHRFSLSANRKPHSTVLCPFGTASEWATWHIRSPHKLEDWMGIILCPRHDRSEIALVCSHIDSTVTAYSPVTEFEVWECYIVDDIGMTHWLCPQCLWALRSRGLPDTGFSCESEEDDAMLERVFEQVEGVDSPICSSCLKECIAMNRDGSAHCE